MTGMRRVRVLGLLAAGMMLLAGPAWATVGNVKSFKEAYPEKDAKATTCKACHTVGAKLNLYGEALAALPAPANPKALTVDDYRAAEAGDADSDGATNGDELKAGTDSADPKSVPPPAPQGEQPSSALPHGAAAMGEYLTSLVDPAAWADEPSSTSDAKAPETKAAESKSIAEYVGTETCAACHSDVASSHGRSAHAHVNTSGPGGMDISCESCHGAGSLHANAGGGRGVGGLVLPSKDSTVCYSCHTDKKMEFSLQYHHPVPEGRMSCNDCHAPHGEKPTPRAARAQNELCLSCHQQIKGPWVFEHLAMRDGCVTCHAPHGSITSQLLTERDFNLCLKCHMNGTQFQQIGHYAHRRALNPAGREGNTCTGCHRAVHGSNFSKELRTQ